MPDTKSFSDDLLTAVAALRPGSRVEQLSDGAVVWAPRPRSLQRLNAAGATVLAELDGERTVAAVADHIADALQIEPARVYQDCTLLVAALLEADVLAVVGPASTSMPDDAATQAGASDETRHWEHES